MKEKNITISIMLIIMGLIGCTIPFYNLMMPAAGIIFGVKGLASVNRRGAKIAIGINVLLLVLAISREIIAFIILKS